MMATPDFLIYWSLAWFLLSLWASGFRAFSHRKWQSPKIPFGSMASRLLHKVWLSRFWKDKTVLQVHEERQSLSWRLHVFVLSLSDTSHLTDDQKLDRSLWTGTAIVTLCCVLLGIVFLATG